MNEFPKNNNNYNWKDLKEIATIVDKSYYILHGFDNVMQFYENIENNVEIKQLKTDNKSDLFFNSTLINKHNLTCKFSEKEDKSKVIYLKSTTTDCEFFAFTYYGTLILLFLGTDSLNDCKTNFDMNKERIFLEGKFCNIHRGFYEQYYSLKNSVLEIFNQYYKNNKSTSKVLILGHSLGTIGQLSSFDIKKLCTHTTLDLITFGAPCVGDKTYVSLLNKNFENNIRIVNNEDIIPVILQLVGFSHSGNLIKFKDKEILYESEPIWNDIKNIGSSIIKYFLPYFGTNVLINHLMSDYILNFENILLSQ